MSSMKVDVSGLMKLAKVFDSGEVKHEAENIAKSKAVAALIGQAIAENFDKEGPGWAPLKQKVIKIKGEEPSRRILQRTGLLRNTATKPDYSGSFNGVKGSNIYRVQGTKIIWGTDLIYAGIHNKGGTIHYPGTKNGFGKGIKIPPHDIKIPKREFLFLSEKWKKEIYEFMAQKLLNFIKNKLRAK